MWQVLVVEDDPVMRDFFAGSVARCKSLNLIAAVGTVAQDIEMLESKITLVDLLLTDLGLPDGSGLDIIRKAIAVNPACESLVISMFGDEENVLASIEAGALGYIHKDSTPDDIAATILNMRNGESPISPMIARRVLAKYRGATKKDTTVAVAALTKQEKDADGNSSQAGGVLSPREQEVLSLIARGFFYAEIARLQSLSVHTVQTHIKRLYTKLSVHSKMCSYFRGNAYGAPVRS